jgi:hypothetical protein
MALKPDSPRTLRITGRCLMLMGAVTLPQALFRFDLIGQYTSLAIFMLGWWMWEKGRS